MAVRTVLMLLAAMALAGCAGAPPQAVPVVETVYVDRPVPVKRQPPAELMALRGQLGPLPVFVDPGDPAATSALTPDGERRLRALLEQLVTGLEAWEAWAAEGQ